MLYSVCMLENFDLSSKVRRMSVRGDSIFQGLFLT